jgi:hypothetical protein
MAGILEGHEEILLSVEFWPLGLRDFGDDPREMLDFLTARDFRLFDYRAGEMGSEWLLRTYRMAEHIFTNLLLVKGLAEVERLRSEVQRWQGEVERDDSETARNELARTLEALRARHPSAPNFPHAP